MIQLHQHIILIHLSQTGSSNYLQHVKPCVVISIPLVYIILNSFCFSVFMYRVCRRTYLRIGCYNITVKITSHYPFREKDVIRREKNIRTILVPDEFSNCTGIIITKYNISPVQVSILYMCFKLWFSYPIGPIFT